MSQFSRAELEAAQKAFESSRRKIEKVKETLLKKSPPPKPQLTLASRNLDALHIALELIEKELSTIE